MSDYTPQTPNVRQAYQAWMVADEEDGWDAAKAFDRWLAQHDAKTAKATEARIIALLDRTNRLESDGFTDQYLSKSHLIALIKGEQ